MIYNIMTCAAPPGTWSTSILGGCSQAWLILGAIFILVMIMRRQTDDGILAGTNFSALGAGIVGLGAALILVTLFGAPKWEFLGGIVGIAAGGFGFALLGIGTGGGSE